MDKRDILFVDVQAVGSPGSGFLLELAWKYPGSRPFSFIAGNPGKEIPRRIMRMTGITQEDIKAWNALPVGEIVKLFIGAAGLYPFQKPLLLVAHHSIYEKRWLEHLTGMNLEILCTRELALKEIGNLISGTLRGVAGIIGHVMGRRRRAANHVIATEAIYNSLRCGYSEQVVSRTDRLSLPSDSGVYRFLDPSGRTLYTGKAANLKTRVNSHFTGTKKGRQAELVSRIHSIEHEVTESAFHAAVRESELISSLSPEYNRAGVINSEKLWYLSPDLTEISDSDQGAGWYGPFLSRHPIAEFSTLSSALYKKTTKTTFVENLTGHPAETLSESTYLNWKKQVITQGVLQYGRSIYESKMSASEEIKEDDMELDGEQHIISILDSILMAGTCMCRRSAFIRVLSGCSITWTSGEGEVTVHKFVDNSANEEWSQRKTRLLMVVLSELKRIYRRGYMPRVKTVYGSVITTTALGRLLRQL